MVRLSSVCAALAALFALATPAHAQNTDLYGGYCGEVTWSGQAPIDAWIIFRTENRWSAPLSVGPFMDGSDGTYTQSGTMVTFRGNEGPHYVITASASGGRIVGEVTADDGRHGVISLTQMEGAGSLLSSNVPPDFVIESAQQALQGDMQGVSRATVWAWTAQGSAYWRAIRQGASLPPDAAEAMRDWIRRAQAGEQPVCSAQ